MADTPWGTDGEASMPQVLEEADAIRIPMGGFCFTPLGLRIDMTATEREELLSNAYGPRID